MTDDDPDLGQLLLSLIAEMKALNLRTGALRKLLHDHLGISEAQYDAALAKVTAAAELLEHRAPSIDHRFHRGQTSMYRGDFF